MTNRRTHLGFSHLRWATAIVAFALFSAGWSPVGAQAASAVMITAPSTGDILQGIVEVRGSASSATFRSAEIAFAFADDPTHTWFTIAELSQPMADALLTTWNTAAISDGEYVLRLRLNGLDGTIRDASVEVQVRNYTAPSVPTPTPSPTSPPLLQLDTPVVLQSSPTPSAVEPTTPTALPPNAAALSTTVVLDGFSRGALAVVAVCILVGVLLIRRRI